jgi:hypothetical protein
MGFYGPAAPAETLRRKWPYDNPTHLKEGIQYYDMWRRNGQDFMFTLPLNSKRGNVWWSPEYSYQQLNWIFASPSIFPRVPDLPALLDEISAPISSPYQSTCRRVLYTPDLLFTVLDWVAPYIPQEIITEEMTHSLDRDYCPPIVDSIKTILSMVLVNKRFHNWIIQSRQDLFFRIIWQMGFMLPACPLDWKSWNAVNDFLPPLTGVPIEVIPWSHNRSRITTTSNAKDWRAYMFLFLRREDRHMQSRYRLHRLHVQHARGLFDERDGIKHKYWSCGALGVGTALECPKLYEWEKEGYTPKIDFSDLGDEDLDDPTENDADSDYSDSGESDDGPDENQPI